MLFLAILLTTFLNTYLTTAAPTSSGTTPCHAKVFDIPWSLTGITFYTPDTTSTSQPTPQGWLRFNFIDYNDRLQLETVCLGNVTNGTVQYGDGGYVICANDNVAFKLVENGLLMASRQYRDKCLGEWPYNTGTAFGQNRTSMPMSVDGTSGVFRVQEELQVKITAMA